MLLLLAMKLAGGAGGSTATVLLTVGERRQCQEDSIGVFGSEIVSAGVTGQRWWRRQDLAVVGSGIEHRRQG